MENTINKVLIGILILLAGLCIYRACEAKEDKTIKEIVVETSVVKEMPVMVIDTIVVTETMTKTTSNTIE